MSTENIAAPANAEELFEQITGEEAPQKHTLLEVWQNLLSNVEQSSKERISLQEAGRWLQRYPMLHLHDVEPAVRVQHSILGEARDIVNAVIEDEPQALQRVDADAEENKHLYLTIVLLWQQMIKEFEAGWDINDMYAGAYMAGYSEAVGALIGPNGFLAQLDEIGFDSNEDDMRLVIGALEEGEGQ